MEAITIESLLTVTGVTLVIGIVLQGIKVAFPKLSTQWIRRVALILGVVFMVIAAWASGSEGAARTLVLLYFIAGVNGIISGLAAGAAWDTFKYGDARTIAQGTGS